MQTYFAQVVGHEAQAPSPRNGPPSALPVSCSSSFLTCFEHRHLTVVPNEDFMKKAKAATGMPKG